MAPKVIFQNPNSLGHPAQQETLDTNRPSIKAESTDRFANAIAISSRGIWADLTQWLTYAAGGVAALELAYMAGLPYIAANSLLIVFALLVLGIVVSTCRRRKSLVFDGAIRALFFITGLTIALI